MIRLVSKEVTFPSSLSRKIKSEYKTIGVKAFCTRTMIAQVYCQGVKRSHCGKEQRMATLETSSLELMECKF